MNYSRFLTAVSQARRPPPIRELSELFLRSPPSTISLAGGLPNPELFPFKSADIKLRDGSTLTIDESMMNRSLQYGSSTGMPELVNWLKKFQKVTHKPPLFGKSKENGGFDLVPTSGCNEGIAATIDMLTERGDNVLIESPTFSGTIDGFLPKGCNLLAVEMDGDGVKPESLRQILSRWKPEDAKNPKSDIPKIFYTIPNGVNPTGISLSVERRHQVYQIAREYDLLILEDDPYYFLQFTEPRPSFTSLDVDGRVIRFDSFSKVLSAGLRLGFVSGPHPFITKIVQHLMVSSMHPSAIAQTMAYEYLNLIGIDGFREHTLRVTEFYKSQRDVILEAAKKHLTGKAEWNEPKAGMFLWMKLIGIKDTKKLILEKAIKKGVLFVPGYGFMPANRQDPSPYVRASFSLASPENIDKGMERLSVLIEEEWKEIGYKP